MQPIPGQITLFDPKQDKTGGFQITIAPDEESLNIVKIILKIGVIV